jgi:adenine-specific DNA-methyltransferase
MAKKKPSRKSVEALMHEEARRTNIPTAELQAVVDDQTRSPIRVAYDGIGVSR